MRKLNNAIDRFCILHPNFGIPNLMLYIVVGNIAIYLLASFSSQAAGLYNALAYVWSGKLAGGFIVGDTAASAFTGAVNVGLRYGHIWRLVTFIFIPGSGGLLFFLYCYFTYSMGRTLEQQWGTAKFTCYYLGGALLTVAGATVVSIITGSAVVLYGASDVTFAMFLAFAVLFPDATFLLFPLPIPIRAKYIAYLDLAYFAFVIVAPIVGGSWADAVVPLMALLNVCVMIWPDLASFLHLEQTRSRQAAHFHNTTANARRQAQQPEAGVRKCAVCGRTNLTNPELDFRYCSRCAGYHCFCSDHIFSHVHFTDENP